MYSSKNHNWTGLTRGRAAAVLAGLLAFRIFYGMSLEWRQPDEVQIYLLGLKFFTTHAWPYFGPDVIHTDNQIAGALQSLLVGLPLFVWENPAAPLVFLNLLSFGGLLWFARRLHRRWPIVPGWVLFGWLMTSPWTLNISTHTYNPSYLLVFTLLFFIGFLEVVPAFAANDLPAPVPYALMGFALVCIQQLHLSWPLLLPFLGVALVASIRAKRPMPAAFAAFFAGAALPALLLVPTASAYGVGALLEALHNNSRNVNGVNLAAFPSIVARMSSLAAFEIAGFIGGDGKERWQLLRAVPWAIPFAALLGALGLVQPLLLFGGFFGPKAWRSRLDRLPRRALAIFLVATIALVGAAFAFTTRPPLTRNFYIMAPVIWIAGYAAFGSFIDTPRRRRLAAGLFAASVALHAGIAWVHFDAFPFRDVPIRAKIATVQRALDAKDYRVLGERRASSLY